MRIRPIVFVVDDDASIRDSLRDLIGSAGLNVQTFASAQEFLASPRPDAASCLVLDVQLPGLSGLDLQQELTKLDAQIPIIFITGHGDIPMTVRAMKAGAIEFLTKPFRDEDLLNAVEQAIKRSRQIEQLRNKPAEEKKYSEGRTPQRNQLLGDRGAECGAAPRTERGRDCGAHRFDRADLWRDGDGKRIDRARHPQS